MQIVSFQDPGSSYFNILETSNPKGIVFSTPIAVNKLIGGGYINSSLTLVNIGALLTDDYTINGDLNLQNGTLNINGNILTVTGNLVLSAGTIDLANGELDVNGSLKQIRGTLNVDGGYLCILGDYINYSQLIMTNEEDYIFVQGNFLISTCDSEAGSLSDGILEIQGDFTQEGNACSFAASGNNMVILSGGKVQNIYFDNPESSYFSGIDVSGSAGVQCNYTRNIDVASIIANLTGLPIDDVINDLNNLSIVDFNSVLNTIANKYINAKNLQYLVENDIGYVVLGLLKSADDNLFWGVVKNIFGFFGRNLTFPEDNYYYMLGKTAGDAIFLAAFLKAASYTDVDAAESLYAACAIAGEMAIGGLVLIWTGTGFVVCESVALEELVEAVGTAAISIVAACVVGEFVSHSKDLLKSDAEKLSEIKETGEAVSNITKIANKWGNLKCVDCADEIKTYLTENGCMANK